jgi:glycosyltransferase involved in cell wall biosynthesis
MLALALVVQGSGIVENYYRSSPRFYGRSARRDYPARPMRIAVVAPVWFPVPPKGYGGIELVVSLLADGLVEAGHDVTLFASGGSHSSANVISPMEEPPDPRELGNAWYDAFHALSAYLQLDGFDVVHDHAGIVGPICGAMLNGRPPVVHTLHGPWTPQTRLLYGLVGRHVHLVAISEAQRADNPDPPYIGTVHNGIDLDSYAYRANKDDVLVYIGRSNPDKGPKEAINIARRAGLPLQMILKRSEPPERAYFEREIEPLLASDIELHENVSHEMKVEMLGRACAMVFPTRWPEPFGLVMVEAMACGTPVVTTNWGAAPELVADGVTGFCRDRDDDLVEAVGAARALSPAACRARVEELFSAEAMVRGYEAVYERAIASAGFPLRP